MDPHEPVPDYRKPIRLPRQLRMPSAVRRHGAATVALLALTLAFYWRVTRHLGGDAWPNDLEDGASVAWNLWHVPHALSSGENPFSTRDIYYPVGAPLAFHTGTPLLALVLWPVTALWGIPTSYVVATLLGPWLSGVGAYLLAHHFLRDRWSSLFAGAAYVMLPDRVLRMGGHMNLNHTEALPFVLLALFAWAGAPTRRRAVLLGVAAAASLYLEPIFTAFLLLAVVAFVAVARRSVLTRTHLVGWAQAAGVATLLALPLVVAMLSQVARGELDPLPGWGASDVTSADVLSYLVPSAFNPLWRDTALASAYSQWTAGERFTFPGWSVLALGVTAAVAWRRPERRTLVVLAATFMVLSLGPFLHVAGHQGSWFELRGVRFSVPLPYLLLHFMPILNGLRIPGRFGLFADLFLGVLAAAGLFWATARAAQRRRWIRPTLALCLIGLLALECLPGPVPVLSSPAIPTPYDAIAADPGHRAVLELPLQWRDGFGRIGDAAGRDHTVFLYYATHHGKPLAGGMTARYPDARQAQLVEIPVYRQVLTLQGDREGPAATFSASDLLELGIGYVVAHRDRPVPQAFAYVEALRLPVLADDGNTVVWRTR